ncbi:putative thioesterase [Desulfofundulus luciae]|uniref:Thioesterase n=1 Tax=Desulfofundulus luciae TaxID=74702 RepID=A0ABU0AY19_9FIRM|nr:thioesterase family protein [Desulfofundulus luciae]MDQ0285371.1 putative thioesterase [Desulfofundulus luciae]
MAGELKIGLRGKAVTRVTEENTALAYGSGGAKVFATPAMIGLMENAALSSVDPLLEPGQITVGIRVDVEHLAATPIGMEVVARSELVEIDGKRLVFRVEAHDEQELIGRGTHERFIVNQERFLSRTAAKLKTTP